MSITICRAISRSKELRMSISENIRMYRKAAGLTQKMLAAKCGLAEITAHLSYRICIYLMYDFRSGRIFL